MACTINTCDRANRTIRATVPGGLSMNAKQKLHQAHLIEWAARFSDQKASGLTVYQWCEQNKVSVHKYHYWKHLLKEEVVDQMLPDIVPLSVPSTYPPSDPPASLEPQPDRTSCTTRASYTTPTNNTTCANRANCTTPNIRFCLDGVSIELDPSVPEEFLRTLVRAVHYA